MPQDPKKQFATLKPRLITVVSPASIIAEALVMRTGADKYGPFNWRDTDREKLDNGIYIDAALRHIFAYWDGQDLDPESGLPHLWHAKASLGVLIDAILNNRITDTRPPAGMAAELLRLYRTPTPTA